MIEEGYQTVTLVPSDTGTGEVSYVLVVQEETKPVLNVDIKIDQVWKVVNCCIAYVRVFGNF